MPIFRGCPDASPLRRRFNGLSTASPARQVGLRCHRQEFAAGADADLFDGPVNDIELTVGGLEEPQTAAAALPGGHGMRRRARSEVMRCSWEQCQGRAVLRADDGEVATVEGGDLVYVQTLGQSDHRGVSRVEA
jgi:hypothetical protein